MKRLLHWALSNKFEVWEHICCFERGARHFIFFLQRGKNLAKNPSSWNIKFCATTHNSWFLLYFGTGVILELTHMNFLNSYVAFSTFRVLLTNRFKHISGTSNRSINSLGFKFLWEHMVTLDHRDWLVPFFSVMGLKGPLRSEIDHISKMFLLYSTLSLFRSQEQFSILGQHLVESCFFEDVFFDQKARLN